MNPDLIYCRTPEGERLARSPRQIASYSQRATLLLLDGQIGVGELVRRFGETLPIEEALEQLERDGLVYPKAAGEPEGIPAGESDLLPAFGKDPLFDPAVEEITEERLVREAPPEPVPENWHEDRGVAGRQEPTLAQAQAAPTQLEEPVPSSPGSAPPPAAASVGSAPQAEPAPPKAKPRAPISKAMGRRLKMVGLAALGFGIAAGAILWVAGLRVRVEAQASAALGVPVAVESVGFAIYHGPALALKNVAIRQDVPLALPRVEVLPDLRRGGLWSAHRLLVVGASLKPSELSRLAGLLSRTNAVTELEFSDFSLRLGELQVSGLAGSLERSAEGGLTLRLADPAGGLRLQAWPSGAGLEVYLTASPGTLPVLGRPKIGSVDLRGTLEDTGMRDAEVGMTGYGGKFEGSVNVGWAGAVSVESNLRMAGVSMSQVSRSLFERGGFSEGQASGTLALRARAGRWEELNRIDKLEASFTVERGALKGFDLGAALRERSPRPISGGETRFETLRGRLEAGPREIRLQIDHLDSGALSASGQLSVTDFENLRGTLSAFVQVPGRSPLQYPAQLAGTVALPSIQLRLPAAAMTGPVPGGAER